MKYRDVAEFRTDREFDSHISALLSDFRNQPLEVLEIRIYMEANTSIGEIGKQGGINRRRGQLIKLLTDQYRDRVKSQDKSPKDPSYVDLMKHYMFYWKAGEGV